MAKPLLLVVTGRAAAGKTTLARRLAHDMRLPLIHKDGIKETLYDTLGAPDRAESRRLGGASLRLQRVIAGELLRAGVSLILEANFREDYDGAALRSLVAENRARMAQVWLTADTGALLERFKRRAGSNERHPGHMELPQIEEFRQALSALGDEPLALSGPTLAMDTTSFSEMDYATARAFVLMALGGAANLDESL